MKLGYCLSYEEVKCKCGCGQWISLPVLIRFSLLRYWMNKALHIFSGCRCKKQNTLSKGASNSQHLYGKALDIKVPSEHSIEEFAVICKRFFPTVLTEYMYKGTLIKYKDHVHVDTRLDDIESMEGFVDFVFNIASLIAMIVTRRK